LESVIDTTDMPAFDDQTARMVERIATLESAVADARDKMIRAVAEAENTKKRALKEQEDRAKYAISAFARDLLDFSNNFNRALESIPMELRGDAKIAGIVDGLMAMDRELLKTFDKHGIRKIDPLDEPFNPNFHEVMFEAPVAGKPGGIVIQVVEAGYILHDRLLKAAKVGVSKSDPSNHQVDQSV